MQLPPESSLPPPPASIVASALQKLSHANGHGARRDTNTLPSCNRPIHDSPAASGAAQHGRSKVHDEALMIGRLAAPDALELSARRRIEGAVRASLAPGAQLFVFGSTMTGLSLPDSDVDLGVTIPGVFSKDQKVAALRPLMAALRKQGARNVQLIPARVPVVKCEDGQSGLHVDLSINSGDGHQNSTWVRECCARYPLLRPLVLVLKCLLQQHELRDTWSGGIGSYLLLLMALPLFQQAGGVHDVGTVLLVFLRHYSALEELRVVDPRSATQEDIGGKARRWRTDIRPLFRQWEAMLSAPHASLARTLVAWSDGPQLATRADLGRVLAARAPHVVKRQCVAADGPGAPKRQRVVAAGAAGVAFAAQP
mmetsp:Transcript_75516/g.200762  ORF Transcript_75516/g.200762 Transcript_75516/m.200762 type:complete len:368 (+) Transcript_75516:3-1106(+)